MCNNSIRKGYVFNSPSLLAMSFLQVDSLKVVIIEGEVTQYICYMYFNKISFQSTYCLIFGHHGWQRLRLFHWTSWDENIHGL